MNATELLSILKVATRDIIGGEHSVAVAYSGGVDSSMIVAIAQEFSKVKCYTCAIEGSLDSRMASDYAAEDRADHLLIRLPENDLAGWVARASSLLGTVDPVRIAYSIPVLCVLEGCEEGCVLAGNGADELFGGYAKYLDAEDPHSMMAADLEKMQLEARILSTIATDRGKRIGFPFASKEVVSFAERTPLEHKVNASGRKLILREVARLMDLCSHDRPKKAAQYSSGILKEMERLSRRERLDLSDWTAKASGEVRPTVSPPKPLRIDSKCPL